MCFLLQGINTILSTSSGSFVPQLSLRHHIFCSDGSIFSPSNWLYIFLVINFHIKSRQDIGLKWSNVFCFDRSFWHITVYPKVIEYGKDFSPSRIWFSCIAICGCNDVRFFSQYHSPPSFARAFELGIFLHCVFSIPWLIQAFIILFTFSMLFCSLLTNQSVGYVLFSYSRYHSKIWYYLQN